MRRLLAAAAAVIILLSACSSVKKSDLKMYVVKRSALPASLTGAQVVSAVEKEGRLAFDGDDIEGYNWQTHYVTLKPSAVPSLGRVTAESGGSAIFKVSDEYALVMTVGKRLVYVAGFKNGVKNPDVPLQPSVEDVDGTSFKITFDPRYATGEDPRSSSFLYSFLQDHGMLSAITE